MAIINWITPDETMDPDGEYTEYAIEFASWILYKLTAEKYPGNTESTEYYSVDQEMFNYMPAIADGQIYNIPRTNSFSTAT